MPRPVCLFTGQWADLPLEKLCEKAKEFGYDGLELACWGDHFDVQRALTEPKYCAKQWQLLNDYGLAALAISNHLVGQAVCDPIDERHKAILSTKVWGDGKPDGVRQRATAEMIDTIKAARKFFDAAPDPVQKFLKERTKRTVVVGFTGSPIWHLLYSFPPVSKSQIEAGYASFAAAWRPILDECERQDISFALEVHPTEIAFDIVSTRRTLAALANHPRFGLNFDPSHFGYQGVDYLAFLREFGPRVWNVHVKDVWWADHGMEAGVFGGHTNFGDDGRFWDFRSPGRGKIDFQGIIRTLNHSGYQGPLTVEWEDPMMDREFGAGEAEHFVRRLDFPRSGRAFDAAFSEG
jgi:sugar phosphate isomerase/epimerase